MSSIILVRGFYAAPYNSIPLRRCQESWIDGCLSHTSVISLSWNYGFMWDTDVCAAKPPTWHYCSRKCLDLYSLSILTLFLPIVESYKPFYLSEGCIANHVVRSFQVVLVAPSTVDPSYNTLCTGFLTKWWWCIIESRCSGNTFSNMSVSNLHDYSMENTIEMDQRWTKLTPIKG